MTITERVAGSGVPPDFVTVTGAKVPAGTPIVR
jgi:hypothetical protein